MDFSTKYSKDIFGVLSGFDRLIIRGQILHLYPDNNFYYFLKQESVMLKDWNTYAGKITKSIKENIDNYIKENNCQVINVNSPKTSKEGLAKSIIEQEDIQEGLVCAIKSVETCYALTVAYNSSTNKLEKAKQFRKCQHYYLYYLDKEFGLMHVRIQTWFPFAIQIYINGKSYLMRQLDKLGIAYKRYENSITWVEDIEKAQQISDKFQEKKWHSTFDSFAKKLNSFLPRIEQIFGKQAYYWTIGTSEYATDILFKSKAALQKYYPYFIEYASLCQMGEDIFTFFGRKIRHNTLGEAVSDRKHFWEQGIRVKFRLDKNSIKMYDKSSVLRIETTINNPKAFREQKRGKNGQLKWVQMRKTISNFYRFAEISKACNNRYLNSLTAINKDNNHDKRIEQLCNSKVTKLSKKANSKARKFTGFNLLSNFTTGLFNAILDGAYKIRGFKNKDIQLSLIKIGVFEKKELHQKKKYSGKITRLLAKLRAHKIISKLPKTHAYRVTKIGEQIISRILLFKKNDKKLC